MLPLITLSWYLCCSHALPLVCEPWIDFIILILLPHRHRTQQENTLAGYRHTGETLLCSSIGSDKRSGSLLRNPFRYPSQKITDWSWADNVAFSKTVSKETRIVNPYVQGSHFWLTCYNIQEKWMPKWRPQLEWHLGMGTRETEACLRLVSVASWLWTARTLRERLLIYWKGRVCVSVGR